MSEFVHAAEFVFPGHPDKLSDAIADALSQEETFVVSEMHIQIGVFLR